MCIIAAKARGIDMPSEETIENMWWRNNDGAGFMYAKDGHVHIQKGFMKYSEFKDALDRLAEKENLKDLAVVMHFRITTHGGTKPANCHPFPISDSIGVLSKLQSKCRIGVAHNGIINITPRQGISDTMEYIASQLAPLSRAVPDFYKNKDLMEMVYNATASRLAFLTGDGHIYTVGDFVEDNGVKYSNSSYKYSTSWRDFGYGLSGIGEWDNYSGINSGCSVDTRTTTNGYYAMKDLNFLDLNSVYLSGIEYYDEYDYYVADELGDVYEYNYDVDAFVRLDGVAVHSLTGVWHFDEEDSSRELVYYDLPPASKSADKKSKKNKKK